MKAIFVSGEMENWLHGYRAFLGVDENVLELLVMVAQPCEMTKI